MTASILWLLSGAAFLALEAFGASGIGFLFAGLAAILVGLIIELGLVGHDATIAQFAVFFIITTASAALLWKKLKAWRTSPANASNYSNMIGDDALVMDELIRGVEGKVRWSGTDMRAILDNSAGVDTLSNGTRVTVTAVNGNVLTVTPKA